MDASPFFKAIQENSDPQKFTIPHFKLYAGTITLVTDIQYYRRVMSLLQHDDALLCKVFLASLDEGSVAWH